MEVLDSVNTRCLVGVLPEIWNAKPGSASTAALPLLTLLHVISRVPDGFANPNPRPPLHHVPYFQGLVRAAGFYGSDLRLSIKALERIASLATTRTVQAGARCATARSGVGGKAADRFGKSRPGASMKPRRPDPGSNRLMRC